MPGPRAHRIGPHSSGNDPLGAQMHGDFSPTKVSMGKSGLRRIQRRVHDRQQLLGLRGRKGNPDSGRELCCVGFPQTDMLSSCLFRNEYADRMGLHILRYGLPSYQIRGGRGRAGSHGACELRQPATAGQADMPCGRGKRAWKRKRNIEQYAHYQLIISRL